MNKMVCPYASKGCKGFTNIQEYSEGPFKRSDALASHFVIRMFCNNNAEHTKCRDFKLLNEMHDTAMAVTN